MKRNKSSILYSVILIFVFCLAPFSPCQAMPPLDLTPCVRIVVTSDGHDCRRGSPPGGFPFDNGQLSLREFYFGGRGG